MNTSGMAVPEENGSTLDVYARPFVPQVLKSINQAAANIIDSLSPPRLDVQKYVQAFAGSTFLTAKSNQSWITQRPAADPNVPALDNETYQAYFYALLDGEFTAQQQQCDDHALYRAPVQPSGNNDPRPWMFTLHVPGLREMSLRIEIGDIVQLRQLRFNPQGEIFPPNPNFNFQ